MSNRQRPYVEWRLDRWKLTLVLVLFLLLLLGVLFWPEEENAASLLVFVL